MTKLKSFALIIATISLFGIIVGNSNAFEIVEFPSDTEDTSWGGYTYHTSSLKTDVPYLWVEWWIDNKLAKIQYGDGTKTNSYLAPYSLTCVIKGTKYEIEAYAAFTHEEDLEDVNWNALQRGLFDYALEILQFVYYDSYTLRMFEPIWLSRPGPNTGAQGTVEISRFYFNGSHIIMDSYAYAYYPRNNPKAENPNMNPLIVGPQFRTHKYPGPNGNASKEHRDTKPLKTIQVGETSPTYNPGPNTNPEEGRGRGQPFHRNVGSLEGSEVYYNAHAHLQVFDGRNPTDNWEVDTQHQTFPDAAVTFTWEDKP